MKKEALSSRAIARNIPLILDELGKADRARITAVSELFKDAKEVNLGQLLQELFPDQHSRETALTALRQFRKRLSDAAEEAGIRFKLEVDSLKKNSPDERTCWFIGESGAEQAISRLVEGETALVDRSSQGAYEIRDDKIVIRYFVSYAHKDKKLKQDFCERLSDQLNVSSNYYFEQWNDELLLVGDDWKDEIAKAIENCHFGLLLVSNSFLASRFITEQELPHFVPNKLDRPEPGKRAIPVALSKVLLDGSVDLKGLQTYQIFHDQEGKPFSQRRGEKKDQFINELFQQIVSVISTRLVVPERKSYNYKRSEEFERCFCQAIDERSLDCYIDSTGCMSSLDKLREEVDPEEFDQRIDAVTQLLNWSESSDSPAYFALLGSLGMGKTSTCLEFAKRLLHHRKKKPELPLPIYFDLRLLGEKAKQEPDLSTIIETVLRKSWRGGLEPTDFSAAEIIDLVQLQGAIAIWDGIDEVLVHLTPAGGQSFIRELLRLLPPSVIQKNSTHGKMLFSCRTHYFRTLREQKNFFLGEEREGMKVEDYRALILLPFSEEQILQYLEEHVPDREPEELLDIIQSIHNLSEMAERPYTLRLIADQISHLEQLKLQGVTVTGVTLYRHMVESWLERDIGKHQLTPHHKQLLMEFLAAELWTQGRRDWEIDDLEQWLIDFFESHPSIAAHYHGKNRELIKEDLRTATFLVREGEKTFRFAHSSLLEFFLACYLYRALCENQIERWDIEVVSPETIDFLGQLLLESNQRKKEIALKSMSAIARMPLALKAKKLVLSYFLKSYGTSYPKASLMGGVFDKIDLSGVNIEGRAEQKINFRSTSWRDSNLTQARFRHVDFGSAIFSGSDLVRTEFIDCDMVRNDFNHCELVGTVFRKCDLTASCLDDIRSYRCKFLYCRMDQMEALNLSPPSIFTVPIANQRVEKVFQQKNKRLLIAGGQIGSITTFCFIKSTFLASGGLDGTIRLWDLRSGECLQLFEGHEGEVSSVAFGENGQLVSSGFDGTIRLWNVSKGTSSNVLKGHDGGVNSVAFGGDGSLVSCGDDGTIRLWDIDRGVCRQILNGHDGGVNRILFGGDGSLVSCGFDGTIRMWDVCSGACCQVFRGHDGEVTSIALENDYLVSGGVDGTIKLWSVSSGVCHKVFEAHDEWVSDVAFGDDGVLASCGFDGTIRLWDMCSGVCDQVLKGHNGEVHSVAYSDSGFLVSCGEDGTVRLWDVGSGVCHQVLRGYGWMVTSVALRGGRLVTAGLDGTIRLWDVKSGTCFMNLKGHGVLINSVAFGDDGVLASCGFDGTVRLWDVSTGICRYILDGHDQWVNSIAFGEGGRLASGGSDGTIQLWDIESGACHQIFKGHDGQVLSMAFGKNGDLASGGADGSIKLWDVGDGTCRRILEGHKNEINSIVFCDNDALASCGIDGAIFLWNVDSGACRQIFKENDSWQNSLAFDKRGRLASAGADGTVRLWDVESGACLKILKGHHGWGSDVAFGEGETLVSSGVDGVVRLWDVATETEKLILAFFDKHSWAAIDPVTENILQVYGDFWRYLSWNVPYLETSNIEILPIESFGPLPLEAEVRSCN
ncbi:TIR domain-containing protein [uncultured Desulfuromonas sp.]|uniref:TIR domain-containing protein n=1 Tax=uncultured Desulfuromonas sp. TaxID=181013 RepID=UPI002AAC17B1|nr:TIR domain-containing protein [uncultured Desulfuromonas sp.]